MYFPDYTYIADLPTGIKFPPNATRTEKAIDNLAYLTDTKRDCYQAMPSANVTDLAAVIK